MSAQRSLASDAIQSGCLQTAVRPKREGWWLLTISLLSVDALALGMAFALAYLLRFEAGIPFLEALPARLTFYSSVAFWAVPAWLIIFALYHLYDRHYLLAGVDEYVRVVNGCTMGLVAIMVISFFDTTLFVSRGWLVLTWLLSIALVAGYRFVARRVVRRVRRSGGLATPTIIVGANEEGKALAEQFLANPDSGVRIVGFADGRLTPGTPVLDGLQVVAGLEDLQSIALNRGVKEIVVATNSIPREEFLELYRSFGQEEGVEVKLSSGLFEILTTGVRVQEVCGVPLVTPQRVRITGIDAFLKSLLDYVGAACGLILLFPLFLFISLLVRLDSPGPVLHRRRVLGREGKPFDAFKFRTMVVNADEVLARDARLREAFDKGYKLKDDPRVTAAGHFLRRTSLDELPQLINVLRGEMSLVGPRMIAPDEAVRYGKWRLNLLTVKPGITGPWQVAGRSDIPYEERVRLSMRYIRNYTIWQDLAILFRTVLIVLRRKGAY